MGCVRDSGCRNPDARYGGVADRTGIERRAQPAAEAQMSAPLAISGLTVSLPAGADRPFALDDVSIELRRGEIHCLIGESGSGKSMIANAILGLLPENVRVTSG